MLSLQRVWPVLSSLASAKPPRARTTKCNLGLDYRCLREKCNFSPPTTTTVEVWSLTDICLRRENGHTENGNGHTENGDMAHSPPDDSKSATWRLHEGISNASRAENLQDLHRLQKSATKPRAGAWSLWPQRLSGSMTG